MDDSISSPTESDKLTYGSEWPIPVSSVAIDGAEPEIGDPIKFTARGRVTRRVNETLYARMESINDMPIDAPVVEPNDGVAEEDRLRQLSQSLDREL